MKILVVPIPDDRPFCRDKYYADIVIDRRGRILKNKHNTILSNETISELLGREKRWITL